MQDNPCVITGRLEIPLLKLTEALVPRTPLPVSTLSPFSPSPLSHLSLCAHCTVPWDLHVNCARIRKLSTHGEPGRNCKYELYWTLIELIVEVTARYMRRNGLLFSCRSPRDLARALVCSIIDGFARGVVAAPVIIRSVAAVNLLLFGPH